MDGFLVQEMVASEGAEFFIGVTHDQLFGPLIACGAGGTRAHARCRDKDHTAS